MNSKKKKKERNIHIPKSLRHQTPLEGGAKWLRKNIPLKNLNWKNCQIVGLLVAEIQYRLRFLGSVVLRLREDLEEKSGRLKDFCLPVSPLHFLFLSFIFFFKGPLRTVMCSRYIYTSQFLKPFSLLKTIIQSFTTNINVNTATYNFFLLKKKKKKNSGSKTWRVCPFQRRGELFHFLDTLTFSVRI